MNAVDLQSAISELGLSKSDLAGLLGVTLRAINLWCSAQREVPGSAVAYIRLLQSLPSALRAKEVARLNKGDATMYDGMYLAEYAGIAGQGFAVLVLIDGCVFGHDSQVQYDGTYEPNHSYPGNMNLNLTLKVPPGVPLAQGVPAQPAEYSFPIHATVPARGSTALKIETPYGPISVRLRYLRSIPPELAA